MRKLISILAIGILIISGLGVVSLENSKTLDLKTEKKQLVFSEPIIKDDDEFVDINLEEATTYTQEAGKPILPVVTQVFTFPFKTKINTVEVIFSEPKNMVLSKEIKPAPEPIKELQITNQIEKDIITYKSTELYPSISYSYNTGSGLSNDEHVIYLAIRCYPVRYSPAENIIYYSESAEIKITYEEPTNPVVFPENYDLVIISPSEFSDTLQPLIEHKNNYGVKTTTKTTEEIYTEYTGFDEAEQIKYFIKYAIETYGVEYVLLIGGIEKLPIRTTFFFQRHHNHYWNETPLTDLYYADIYDENGSFCDWDSNENHMYGETYYNCPGVNDTVDLYADVNIGRIPCVKQNELRTVINKIIKYEKTTNESDWYNNIILIGGDTFPGWNGYEGEEKNDITEQIMSDFTPTRLRTSDSTFNARSFKKALNNGAGFVDYSGHGFEIGMSTHPPNSDRWIGYYFFNLFLTFNGNKLPIVFFDACLTAKLDFNVSQFIKYALSPNLNFNQNSNIKTFNLNNIFNPIEPLSILSKLTPTFAWSWVKKKHGGAIATIGATRTAYGDLTYGCGYLSLQFYRSYATSKTLSQMLTKAQNVYINNIREDPFTVEEFIIIGDPSLKLGGY